MRPETPVRHPIRPLTAADANYPERVRAIGQAPDLWVQGVWPWPEQRPVVAIVGSRAASKAGFDRAREMAAGLARAGVLVLSGGAVGIDSAAHLGALDAGGATAATLAPGLDNPYPAQHRPLFEAIVERGGTLISSVPPGSRIARWQFPARNQIMAALADCVVVVECSAISGSMITVRAGARLGKVIAACPGSPGADGMIALGAALAETAADVLAALAGHARAPAMTLPAPDTDEGRTLAALDPAQALAVDTVGERAGLPALVAARALSALELEGLALPVPGGRYLRAAHAARP